MLLAIAATNSQGAVLNIPLGSVSGGIALQNIDGLDPVKATLVSSSFANLDGAQYHSSRREPRNIKLTMGLDSNYAGDSVQNLRKRLYTFFMPKAQVTLRFYSDDGTYVDILGRVESLDTALFTKEPAVDISLVCFDPDFQDPTTVIFNGTSTAGSLETTISYNGTIETGVIFKFLPTRSVSAFTIYHRPPDGTLRTLEFSYPLVANDIVTIKTQAGNKSASLTRAGNTSSILYALTPQSNWLALQSGTNYLRIYALGADIQYTLEYTNRYGGL